jgi:IPT/TIG domain
MRHPPARSRGFGLRPALLTLLLLAACSDGGGPTTAAGPPTAPPPAPLGAVACEADVALGTVTCAPPSQGAGGALLERHVLGGQGEYVRLASSGVAYAGGVFSFNVTVQNLSSLALGTQDGAARDAEGVRVFFHSGPTATSGSGTIAVANATGTAAFTAAGQPYFQYGGQVGGADRPELGADGVLSSSETSSALQWQLNVPATVGTFSFVLYVSTHTPSGAVATVAPQVTGVSPAAMVPGASATLTGINFDAVPGNNTVAIGGVAATVTGATATSLTVTVPCVVSGTAPVQVTRSGMRGAVFSHPVQAARLHTLAAGQAVFASGAGEAACNELAATGGPSRYLVAVYNTSTAPLSTTGFRISGADGVRDDLDAPLAATATARAVSARAPRPGGPAPSLDAVMALARARRDDEAHYAVLEKSREAGEQLRQRFAGDPRMRASRSADVSAAPPPAARAFRVSNLNAANICTSYFTVNATRVYHGGKVVIYEDDAVAAGLKAANNAAMQGYYNRIGDSYNDSMEPVLTASFGNPLLRDASTDNNGLLVMLFTPVVNNLNLGGFVVSCDQYPNDEGSTNFNTTSNFGEYFYARAPTVVGTGFYGGETPDNWFWTMQPTIIHEAKHVASHAARVAAGAPFEHSWLEEGTARHSEELWLRQAVYNAAWKGNTGYGSAAAPGSIYCDVRPGVPACDATSTSRPVLGMYGHYSALYTALRQPGAYSPFGRTAAGGFQFYAVSWSLVRYAIDRYGSSDAAFLSALNQSGSTGAANLAARAGVPIERLLGGWALALYTDDLPGLPGGNADLQIPTWNFTSVFEGLNDDYSSTFPLAYPLTPTLLDYGFAEMSVPSLAGGGVAYFEIAGHHLQPQLLRLRSTGGGAPPSTLRMAVARLN